LGQPLPKFKLWGRGEERRGGSAGRETDKTYFRLGERENERWRGETDRDREIQRDTET